MNPALVLLALPALAHADLWVPEQMIQGGSYSGMVLLQEPSAEARTLLLASDDPLVAGVPGDVSVGPHSNHGVFGIEAGAEGKTRISAVVDGRLVSRDALVVGRPDGPASLLVTLPAESAHPGRMPAYVTVLDGRGAPVAARTDVELASSGGVLAPPSALVPDGRFQAQFWVDVRGDGSVTASAPGLAPHTASVSRASSEIDVRVAVAPRIALQDSHAFYYVWLERDGRPFKPPRALEAFVHTGDSGVAGASAGRGEGAKVVLAGGAARGLLYTRDAGAATVTVSVPGAGTARDVLLVGPARMDGGQSGSPEFSPAPRGEPGAPDLILTWAYPSVTDGRAWAVSAAYSSRAESGSPVLSPVRLPGGALHVASGPGLLHDGAYLLEEKTTKTNAVEFEVDGAWHGEHWLSASGQGMDAGNEARLEVAPPGGKGVRVTPLPALPGERQALALVWLEEGGALAGPESLPGRAEFSVSAVSAKLDRDTAEMSGGAAVVHGTLTGSGSLTASADGLGSHTAPLEQSPPPVPLSLQAPPRVHAGEPFPFAVHGPGGAEPGADLRIAGVWSELGASARGGMMVLERPGRAQVSVVAEAGAASAQIEAFENYMELDLRLSGERFRVGEQAVLEAGGPAGASYRLDTDLPFERSGPGRFLVTVDREGESRITVTASQDGYAPASASASVSGRHAYRLEVSAHDSQGAAVHPQFSVASGSVESAAGRYSAELRPGPVTVEFPAEHREAGRGYALARVYAGGEPASNPLELDLAGDVSVRAVYERQVLVVVEGGLGSGTYAEGSQVRVSAPDRPVLWLLVRDVFERWEGLESGSAEAVFAASEDVRIKAEYRRDWTYLLLAVGSPLAGAAAIGPARGSARLRWAAEAVLERIGR